MTVHMVPRQAIGNRTGQLSIRRFADDQRARYDLARVLPWRRSAAILAALPISSVSSARALRLTKAKPSSPSPSRLRSSSALFR